MQGQKERLQILRHQLESNPLLRGFYYQDIRVVTRLKRSRVVVEYIGAKRGVVDTTILVRIKPETLNFLLIRQKAINLSEYRPLTVYRTSPVGYLVSYYFSYLSSSYSYLVSEAVITYLGYKLLYYVASILQPKFPQKYNV